MIASAVIYIFRYGWIHLLAAIVKEDGVSHQSCMDIFRYGWMNLLPVIVKEDSISRQSSTDLFKYGRIHLLPVIVKADSVSVNLVWMYSAIVGFTYKLQ
jgi:hypothetical protein